MIHVIAEIEIAEGRRGEFLEEFRRLVPDVRKERGCLEYGPAVDIPTDIAAQPVLRPNHVTVIEKWDDVDSLRAHLKAPHVATYRERVKDLVVRASICVLEPA
jgi:quinol monooxygenase YgiN